MKIIKIVAACLLIGLTLSLPIAASAQTATAQRYQIISSHCKDLHTLIDQLQRRDLVSRTNLGREYEGVDNELNAFNQRIHNNNLDDSQFVQLMAQFDAATGQFRDAYVHYDDSINKLQSINCQSNPADFDAQLNTARSLRDATEGAASRAAAVLGQYNDAAVALQAQLPNQANGGAQ